jgi:hypothetical protein
MHATIEDKTAEAVLERLKSASNVPSVQNSQASLAYKSVIVFTCLASQEYEVVNANGEAAQSRETTSCRSMQSGSHFVGDETVLTIC